MDDKYFIQHLILDTLSLDDESLELLIKELIESRYLKDRLKYPYNKYEINEDGIKNSLNELAKKKCIVVLDDEGQKLDIDNLNKIYNSKDYREYWFEITDLGKIVLEKGYKYFWKDL